MPELPEVEYAARQLRTWLRGRRVAKVTAEPTRVIRPQTSRAVASALEGHAFDRVERRAKYLLLYFDRDAGALSHLGMTGKWLRRAAGDAPSHSRVQLALDDGSVLHYRDPRMFGRFNVCPARQLRALPEIAALGPDPLADGFTARVLGERLGRTRRAIKPALMDQRVVGGLGNIQAAEALYRARIHPERSAAELTGDEVARLAEAIQASIAHALKEEDAPEIEYVEEGGENPFLVYARKGERCPRCTSTIDAFVQGARTTYFCPGCQRLPGTR